jgi:tetratricopeptide (TPR) repeat protein
LRQGEPHNAARELEALEQRRDDWTRFERIFVDWCAANLHGKRPEALAHLRRMYGIAPHLLWVVYNLSLEMNWQNRPLETIDVLGPILPQYGLESNLFGWRLLYPALSAYHMTGEYEHQLEWSNKGLEAYPAIGDLFLFKGGALAAMGRCEDVSALVGEMSQVRLDGSAQNAGVAMAYIALELRAHGCRVESEGVAHRAADWFGRRAAGLNLEARESSDLYQHSFALRVAGRWDEARSPLEELQKRGFRPFVVAGALGVIAANTGDRGEARRILHEFPKPGPSSDPGSRDAWRAAIAAHLGEKEMAVELLKQSFASGYAHEWYHRIDLDFEPLWDYPPFQELIKPKG